MDDFPATQVLESTQVLDATQILGGDDVEDSGPVVVGRLEVGLTKYQVVVGDNRIGRDPRCEVFISNPSLSRTHAVIEADRDGCTLHDVKSSNGTRKGGAKLRPNIRYNLESGEQLVFGDVTAVFIAGVESDTAADSDNDSNVSDSLFDMEDNVDGDDENQPPNFVPDTPVGVKAPIKPLSRPSLGDLSFVPESQSSPLPTSILKQQALFKVPDSPATDLDDSSFLCPSQQPVQARERPSRLVQGSFRPGQDRTSTQLLAPIEQLETSVSSDKSDGKATVVPDSDEEDDMFAFGPTQAVNDTDDEAFGPTQAVNETVEEPLATQAVDETVDDTITDEKNDESSDQQKLLGLETQKIDSKNPKSVVEEGLLTRVDTADLNVLFNKVKPDIVQSGLGVSKCEALVLGADTQAIGLLSADTQAPYLFNADTQAPDILCADTQAPDNLSVETQVPDMMSADTQKPDLLGADTQAPDLLAADTQAPDLLGADTQAPDLMGAETQAPDLMSADTQAPDLMSADTQALDLMSADTQAPDLMSADTQAPDLMDDFKQGVQRKLNDSEIMCASTQALVARLSDSDIIGASDRAVGSKLSDSYIMCASTQALVARLSESDLLGANTQAMTDSSMNDSLMLGSATQAVTRSEAVTKPREGLHVVDSMDLLESDNPSSCDTSAEDLLMLATQPVFKLPCLPMGKSKSSTSLATINLPEANSALDADTEPLGTADAIFDAETALLEDPTNNSKEPDELGTESAFLDADTVQLGTAALDTENESNEDETQCLESFTDVKDALEADTIGETVDSVMSIPPPNVEDGLSENDDDAASDVSDDLLANEEDLELKLDDTHNESTDANNSETSRLSNTTLTSVSMIEASQPFHHMTKGISVNNRTDFNSLTMDQTSVVESDIVSANDDTDAMSDASDNLLEDQEDLPTEEAFDLPPEVPKAVTPAPIAALLLAENIDSPLFKKRTLTPVEIAIRNNTLANDSKDLCLLLDSSIEDSPIFRKKNSSVCSAVQNNSGLIKSLIESDESSEKDEILDVTLEPSNLKSPEPSTTCVEQAVNIAANEDKHDVSSSVASVTKLNSSISVRRRSSTPEEVLNSTKEVAPSEIMAEIIAEVVSPAKSPDADSGPLLPETQALRVEEEEISDDEMECMDVDQQERSDIKADQDDGKKDNVVEEEVLGKGKRVRKLTPKADKLQSGTKILDQEKTQEVTITGVETPLTGKYLNRSVKSVSLDELETEKSGQKSDDLVETPVIKKTKNKSRKSVPKSEKQTEEVTGVETPQTPTGKDLNHSVKSVINPDKPELEKSAQKSDDLVETPVINKDKNKSRKSVTKAVKQQLKSPGSKQSDSINDTEPEPEKSSANEVEETTAEKSEDLGETPVAPAVKRLGRGKRGKKVNARTSEIKEAEKVIDIAEVAPTDTEVAETQPWIPTSEKVTTSQVSEEEATQAYDRDPEVLLPGQNGIEVDTCAETQPLEETIDEEPVVKKNKISDGNFPPVKKSSRRSQVAKPPLDDKAPTRSGRRKSAVQALADLQPVRAVPRSTPDVEAKQIVKARGKSLKLPSTLLLDSEESKDTQKNIDPRNQVVNKLGRRNKKLKMPSSLLIESPAAEDMFVDDADSIPSPLTNGTPVIPLKTKGTRKFRSKATESETVADDLEAIDEDEPVGKRRTVRSRNSRANNTTNVQSAKPKTSRASLQGGPSRKSLDDFSPRSKTKMETKLDKVQSENAEKVLTKQKQEGKARQRISVEPEEAEQVEPDKEEVAATGVDMSVTAGEALASRRNRRNKEEETASALSNAAPRRGGRGKKTTEVAVAENVEKLSEVVDETIVVVKSKRGRANKTEAIDNTVVEPKPVARGRGRKNDPANSTVAVMEAETAPAPPVAAKRGGRNRRTEPVNIEPQVEVPSGRRTRNTSGASTASNTSTRTARNAQQPEAAAESELIKTAATDRKGKGRKDSETSTVSTVSNTSGKGKKGKKVTEEPDATINISSSTGSRGRKRPAEETPEGSSSKKRMEDVSSTGSVRSRLNSSMDSTASPSLRKVESLTKKKHLVMFTGYNDQTDITLVKELNGSTTDSLTDCTVLVTDQIRRTAKFLSMVGRGVPIVAPLWLTESKRTGKFLDPWDFILKDPTNEKKWGFKLEDTLRKACRAKLLAGLSIHVTGLVKPSAEQCKDFIECGGGEFIETLPTKAIAGLHVVSCADDKKLTTSLAKMGVPIMDKEWMLSGLLKYKLDKNLKLK